MLSPSILLLVVTMNGFLLASSGPILLYIPEAMGDGQPVTADPIGTDSIGYTTWRVRQGVPSGTFKFTGPQTGVATLAPATLVLGSTDAHLLIAGSATTVREDCVFATGVSGGPPLALCSKYYADPTFTTTAAVVETVTPTDVQTSAETSDKGVSGWSFFVAWTQAVPGCFGLGVYAS